MPRQLQDESVVVERGMQYIHSYMLLIGRDDDGRILPEKSILSVNIHTKLPNGEIKNRGASIELNRVPQAAREVLRDFHRVIENMARSYMEEGEDVPDQI